MEPENNNKAIEALQKEIEAAIQAGNAAELYLIIRDAEKVLAAAKEQLNKIISATTVPN